jgi:UDP-sulfoquinovose synthase
MTALKILIAGIDGYLGWALASHLADRGHEVAGIDNGFRREWVEEMGSVSAIPIASLDQRAAAFERKFGKKLNVVSGDLTDQTVVRDLVSSFLPDTIVQLGECPSAPYSMIDADHAVFVQTNNLTSTFNLMFAIKDLVPDAHLVKLGTMGEYGTPNVDIPEGFFEIEYKGRKDRLPFPRQAGSFYHWSKVHGSNNIMFASKIWGLRATDIMQGVVYGTTNDAMGTDEDMQTRLDFDQSFGTAINRFVCSAVIDEPLTLFGNGHQKRGFLPLKDSMQCLTLAIEKPAAGGEYRVLNQFEEVYSVVELADKVREVGSTFGLDVKIANYQNPRIEAQDHHYSPEHQNLLDLGYKPTRDMASELEDMFKALIPQKSRIAEHRDALIPDIRWDGSKGRVDEI